MIKEKVMLQKLKVTSYAFIFMLIAFGFSSTSEGAQYIPDANTCDIAIQSDHGTKYEKMLCKCYANPDISTKKCEKKAKKFALRNLDEFRKSGRLKPTEPLDDLDPCSSAGVTGIADALVSNVMEASHNIGQEPLFATARCEVEASKGPAGGGDDAP
mgnify:FL=1